MRVPIEMAYELMRDDRFVSATFLDGNRKAIGFMLGEPIYVEGFTKIETQNLILAKLMRAIDTALPGVRA